MQRSSVSNNQARCIYLSPATFALIAGSAATKVFLRNELPLDGWTALSFDCTKKNLIFLRCPRPRAGVRHGLLDTMVCLHHGSYHHIIFFALVVDRERRCFGLQAIVPRCNSRPLSFRLVLAALFR